MDTQRRYPSGSKEVYMKYFMDFKNIGLSPIYTKIFEKLRMIKIIFELFNNFIMIVRS